MLLPSRTTSAVLLFAVLLGRSLPALAQPAQPPAELSRLDIGAYVSFKQTSVQADGGTWTGPGLSLDINANVSERFAVATRIETYFDRSLSALAGTQVSTGFHYANGRDPVPGRFFAKALAGAVRDSAGVTRPALHLGAGADIILSGARGVGLHWDTGWEIVPGDARRRVRAASPLDSSSGRTSAGAPDRLLKVQAAFFSGLLMLPAPVAPRPCRSRFG